MKSLPSLNIGGVHVAFPLVLAPLAGYTDVAFRRLCRQLGPCGYTASEMTLDRLLLSNCRKTADLLALHADDHPVAGQLIGNEPGTMAAAAGVMAAMGYDVIDLNFACPVNKALRRRRGGWLMRDPELGVAIVRAVVASVDCPVTVKLRVGFAGDDGAFWRLAEGAFDAGASAICIHGRTVQAKYSGPADWEFIARARAHFTDRTIIGSGDVLRPERVGEMIQQTGVDGVLAARGVLGNPWLFAQVADLAAGREIRRPSVAEQREVICRHLEYAVELYGPQKATRHMRKFGIKYARMHPTPKRVRMAFVEVKTPRQWHEVLREHYTDAAGTQEAVTWCDGTGGGPECPSCGICRHN